LEATVQMTPMKRGGGLKDHKGVALPFASNVCA